jgi:hypothetical protein
MAPAPGTASFVKDSAALCEIRNECALMLRSTPRKIGREGWTAFLWPPSSEQPLSIGLSNSSLAPLGWCPGEIV